MEEPIVNRVQQSALAVVDLAELAPEGARTRLDIAQWLDQGLLLREKEFRTHIETHDWTQYHRHFVAVHCSTAAIFPAWATLLVSSKLAPFAQKVVVGTLETLENTLFTEALQQFDVTPYKDRPVMIKGCSDKQVPENAYVLLLARLQKVAKKISYGEACAAVPLWKRA